MRSAAGVKLALGTAGWIFGSKVQSVMQDEREFAGCLQIYIYDAAVAAAFLSCK